MHAGVSATGVKRLNCYVTLTVQGHMGTRERWGGGSGGGVPGAGWGGAADRQTNKKTRVRKTVIRKGWTKK